jgi:hypothetical protein
MTPSRNSESLWANAIQLEDIAYIAYLNLKLRLLRSAGPASTSFVCHFTESQLWAAMTRSSESLWANAIQGIAYIAYLQVAASQISWSSFHFFCVPFHGITIMGCGQLTKHFYYSFKLRVSAKTPLQEIFNLESQHVIKTYTGFVKHTDTVETTNESVSFKEMFGIFVFEFKFE